MKIEPMPGVVYLKLDEAKVGALDTSSRSSAVEFAEVLAVGETKRGLSQGDIDFLVDSTLNKKPKVPDIKGLLKPGDKVFVKAWAIDNIVHNDVKYHFVHIDTNGILAIVK